MDWSLMLDFLATPIIVSALAGFLISVVVVPVVRNIAKRKGILDIPNERSSHKIPTPRTGGVGIFTGSLVGVVFGLILTDQPFFAEAALFYGIFFAGAAIGFGDDLLDLPTLLRMGLYLACAATAALYGASIDVLQIPGVPTLKLGQIGGVIFSTLFIAWYTNLFNFMDGIDGIAGGAAIVTLGGLAFLFGRNGETSIAIVALASAGACVGFIFYNFPPASVFMGDGGAVFLGLQAGTLSLLAVTKKCASLSAVVLLMLPFVFDATFTLIRRMINKERFWAAHRSHIYQQMCDLGMSHRTVSTGYTAAAAAFALLAVSENKHEVRAVWSVLWWVSVILLFVWSWVVVIWTKRQKG